MVKTFSPVQPGFEIFKLFFNNEIFFLVNIKLSIPAIFIVAGNSEKIRVYSRGTELHHIIKIGTILLVLYDVFIRKVTEQA